MLPKGSSGLLNEDGIATPRRSSSYFGGPSAGEALGALYPCRACGNAYLSSALTPDAYCKKCALKQQTKIQGMVDRILNVSGDV